ncbi:MAG: response regulator transcription factor, partial [Bacteroidales bacterium]|nr:response regulator transcription factor [Bacteroidales bacterium]
AGINGFISKRQSNTFDLINAINSVMNNEEYFGRDITALIYDIFISKKYDIPFTEREREIISICHKGLQSKEIAAQLNISAKTVENHKTNIFKKLGINNTVELVNWALKNELIDLT